MKNKDKIKFSELIETHTEYKVLALTEDMKPIITPLIKQAIEDYNSGPIWQGRVNEFGNYMETVLQKTNPKFLTKPTKKNGKKQSTGYPDLRCEINGVVIYVEVKVYNQGNDDSAMRSFYISTYDKITADAVHVVIGFEHVDKKLTGSYHIVDMKDKTLVAKHEFSCGNNELYRQ